MWAGKNERTGDEERAYLEASCVFMPRRCHRSSCLQVAYKHVANGAYPAAAFVLAGALAHLPVAITETLIYSSIVYFSAGA